MKSETRLTPLPCPFTARIMLHAPRIYLDKSNSNSSRKQKTFFLEISREGGGGGLDSTRDMTGNF